MRIATEDIRDGKLRRRGEARERIQILGAYILVIVSAGCVSIRAGEFRNVITNIEPLATVGSRRAIVMPDSSR